MTLAYTPFKIFHFSDTLSSMSSDIGTPAAPIHVRIKPINLCNQKGYLTLEAGPVNMLWRMNEISGFCHNVGVYVCINAPSGRGEQLTRGAANKKTPEEQAAEKETLDRISEEIIEKEYAPTIDFAE